jgi:pimeloyl-ACP methyl ester carboxylesterase
LHARRSFFTQPIDCSAGIGDAEPGALEFECLKGTTSADRTPAISPEASSIEFVVSDLVSFGGDPRVVATRSEIERITNELALVQRRITDELHPLAQIHGLVHHIQFDSVVPEVLVRLGLQRHGCFVAGESYFTTDARLAHKFNGLGEFLHENPWLANKVPNQVWLALGGAAAVAGFTNTDFTALAIRAGKPLLPTEEVGRVSAILPDGPPRLVEQSPRENLQNPNTIAALTGRLNNEDGRVRIERYQGMNEKTAVVYLPGTAEWNPAGSHKAFDIRSDLELASGNSSADSVEAVRQAISAAGLAPNEKVILVGYSQGGMIAANLAESGLPVSGIVTIGSPIAESEIPKDIPVISIEHTNDVVPAISGKTNPISENWVTATRHFDLHAGQSVIAAHAMSGYQETAALADRSTDVGMIHVKQEILGQLSNAKLMQVREFAPLRAAS